MCRLRITKYLGQCNCLVDIYLLRGLTVLGFQPPSPVTTTLQNTELIDSGHQEFNILIFFLSQVRKLFENETS